jgi:hypothetical protein
MVTGVLGVRLGVLNIIIHSVAGLKNTSNQITGAVRTVDILQHLVQIIMDMSHSMS